MVNRRKTAAFSAVALLIVLATWWWVGRDWEAPEATVGGARSLPAPDTHPLPPPPPQPQPVAEVPPAAHEPSTAPPAPAPEASEPPPEVPDTTDEARVLSGRVIDARGQPLVGHLVRLSDPPGARPAPGATGRALEATTDADGSFTLADVRAGTQLVQLLGPGEGDIATLQRDLKGAPGVGVGFIANEGTVYLAVPPGGLDGVELVGPRHACFWVEGQLEPAGTTEPAPEHVHLITNCIHLRASVPDWGEVFDPLAAVAGEVQPAEHDPQRITLQLPLGRGLERSFLVGADEPSDTLLVIAVPGYATQTRKVQGELVVERVGTIVLQRVAGLVVDVSDAVSSRPVEEGSIELRETGGGMPDRVSVHEVRGEVYGDMALLKTIWSERASGRYELHIRCPGYAEWTGSGDLILGDPEARLPTVTAELHRTP
ncbi:MAG TPA: carboxypeptidase-like regulatory domain-containing protein [Planctomycetota bacterium]|nr:carboxypeptidase-like regulatory domain-containing protein [Planctomycetota bacterium]